MKITFLGTGTSQGIPVIACNCDVCKSSDSKDKRLRSSVLIEDEIINLVIDTGPDFRQQMLNAQVHHLEGVLLTHGHKDHIAGLDDVRAFNYVQRKAIDVYARNDVHETLKTEFSYAFAVEKYPGVPEIHLHEIKNKTIQNQRFGNTTHQCYALQTSNFWIQNQKTSPTLPMQITLMI